MRLGCVAEVRGSDGAVVVRMVAVSMPWGQHRGTDLQPCAVLYGIRELI